MVGQDISKMQELDRIKNEFISTASHELRTPLTSIRGSLGLVAGGVTGEIPDQAKNLVDIALGVGSVNAISWAKIKYRPCPLTDDLARL